MKVFRRLYASVGYWQHSLSVVQTLKGLLAAFGMLWLLVEVVQFFAPGRAAALRGGWWLFLIVGVLWALWESRPMLSFSHRLADRDVVVTVTVGELFEIPGALLVASNTTFDTELSDDLISKTSVQGQFTLKYYDNPAHLDRDIEQGLRGVTPTAGAIDKRGKRDIYPIGTVVRVRQRDRTAYLVAIASLNEHGTAKGSLDDLKNSLAQFWDFVGTRGTNEPLVTPIIGSGYSRITAPRETIIQEIVKSFVAACAASQFCEGLTIVIRPEDFVRYRIDMPELSDFVKHLCRYSHERPLDSGTVGTPAQE